LGAHLFDAEGGELPPGGGALHRLASIDTVNLDPRLSKVQFEIAVDVDNPLCGERGAAAIFGPQKGATPENVDCLDKSLAHFAAICAQTSGRDESEIGRASCRERARSTRASAASNRTVRR